MQTDKVTRRSFFKSSGLAAAGVVLAAQVSPATAQTETPVLATGLKIVTFKVDVTPPVGEPLAYDPNEKVETPIYVSGIVVDDGKTRAV